MESSTAINQYEPRPFACPLFYTEDEEAEIFGRYCEGEDGAVGIKTYKGFTSIWCGAKFLQPDFIRSIAAYAGCHIYSWDEDVIYTGSGFLTIHATESGNKKILFPKTCSPYEVYERNFYAENTMELQFEMEEGETKMFYLKTMDCDAENPILR